jgi:molybdate transport system permease protein
VNVDLGSLFLSLEVSAIATLVAIAIGVSVAALLANVRFAGRDLVDVLFTAPIVMPPTVLGYYVLVLLGRNSTLGRAFEDLTGASIVFTKTGAVLAAVIGTMPLVVKSVRTSLEETDPSLVLAARTLGASPMRAFLTIQLPLAGRGITAAAMLAFARALGDFGLTWVIGGNVRGQTHTAAIEIYDAIQAQREGDALALSLVLTTLAVLLLYAVNKLSAKSPSRRHVR